MDSVSAKVDAIWADDLMHRRKDAEMIIEYLKLKTAERAKAGGHGYVLNLDSGWGYGKTFFLTRLRDHLRTQGHIAVYVNGWLDDSSSEPLVSVIAETDKELAPFLDGKKTAKSATGQIMVAVAKGAFKRAATKYLADGVDDIVDLHDKANVANVLIDSSEGGEGGNLGEDTAEAVVEVFDKFVGDQVENYRSKVASMESFKRSVSGLLAKMEERGKTLPMFILVDELDRCRPTYSLLMLESIKHIFDIKNVAFVIATDSDQLQESVRAVYGAGFNSQTYLKRFFDRVYRFQDPALDDFVALLVKYHSIDIGKFYLPTGSSFEDVVSGAARFFGLSLRDLVQCFDSIATFAALWRHEVRINAIYLLALVMLHHKSRYQDYARLVDGSQQAPAGPKGMWVVSRNVSRIGERGKVEKNEVVNLLASFRDNAKSSLPHICGLEYPQEHWSSWVRQYFQEEMQKEHPGGYHYDNPPASVLLKYPEYLQRLSNLH